MSAGTIRRQPSTGTGSRPNSRGRRPIALDRRRRRSIPGRSLERLLVRSGPLPAAEVRRLLRRLAVIVARLHRKGIVHGDLKPGNVVIGADGRPTLIDFETARRLCPSTGRIAAIAVGSAGYAPPERYLGADEGRASDIYALAAIGWRALTGRPPPAASLRLAAGTADPCRRPPAASADPALALAIAAGLALDRRRRPADTAAWLAILHGAAAPEDGALAADDGPPTLPIPRIGPGPAEGDRHAIGDGAGGGDARLGDDRSGGDQAGGDAAIRRRRRRFLLFLLLVGLLLPALAWLARPLYQRYVVKEWRVDAAGGDTVSIGEAVARAPDGARIRVAPGRYAEPIVLSRRLRLEAADPAQPPELAPPAGPCGRIDGDGAALVGFVIRQTPPATGTAPACLVVSQGSPLLEGNRLTAAGTAIRITDGARPTLRGNRIADTPAAAIDVVSGARPSLVDNIVEASGSLVFAAGAGGVVANNVLRAGTASAIQIAAGADPEISGNRIERPKEAGIFVYDGGRGRITGNTIVEAGLSGIVIAGGDVVVTGNRVERAGEHGILVLAASGGRIADNTLADNRGHGLVVAAEARVTTAANPATGNRGPQVLDLRRP